ncbi:MAG: helix-turn-helix domain-containing protein [Dehalobacterium sp.]
MRDKLVALRKQKEKELGYKLTQEKVASQLNISRSFYNMIETGDRDPRLQLAKKIADFFGVKMEEIFFNEDDSNTNRKTSRKTKKLKNDKGEKGSTNE